MSGETNWVGWLGIRGPDGLVHLLGETGEDVDLTECRIEICRGWYALGPDTDPQTVCAKCVNVIMERHQRNLIGPVSFSTGTECTTIIISDCHFGGRS